MTGFICAWNHEEIDLTPLFSNVDNLVAAINSNPESWEIGELPDKVFDYPSRERISPTEHEREVLQQLKDQLAVAGSEEEQIQLAFSIMALTPLENIEQLYPYLDHKNMYIQERAIRIMGFYRYEPVREKLTSLAATAKHNGRTAVQTVLRVWDSPEEKFVW